MGVTSFTISADGKSLEIPVRVLPIAMEAAAFSNPTPAMNEPVTVTAPGFTFHEGGAVVFSGIDTAIVLSRAEDGSSVTFLPVPGSTGPAIIDSVAPDFVPDVRISLSTGAEIAVATTPIPGTASTATAPSIEVPAAVGESRSFFDVGTFTGVDITGDGGFGTQYYQFTIPADGFFRFVTNWFGTPDMDAIVCFDADCSAGTFAGTGAAHPEDGTLQLTAGTYYFAVVFFGGTEPPETISLTITQVAPPSD